jgi:putative transposase
MFKVVKIRLYPNTTQKKQLAKTFGSCRWVWNYFLNLINQTYKDTGKGLLGYDINKDVTDPEERKRNILVV